MRSRRTAIVAAVLVSSFPLTSTAKAADACLSKSQARSVFGSHAHLYWSVGPNGRCWANSLRAARAMAQGSPAPRAASAPGRTMTSHHEEPGSRASRLGAPPVRMPPTELMPPQLAIVTPPSILDSPRWAWVADARAAAHDDDIPFSTFAPGAEPDVWPPLDDTSRGGIVIVVMSGLFAMALGLALWRWRLDRVRIT